MLITSSGRFPHPDVSQTRVHTTNSPHSVLRGSFLSRLSNEPISTPHLGTTFNNMIVGVPLGLNVRSAVAGDFGSVLCDPPPFSSLPPATKLLPTSRRVALFFLLPLHCCRSPRVLVLPGRGGLSKISSSSSSGGPLGAQVGGVAPGGPCIRRTVRPDQSKVSDPVKVDGSVGERNKETESTVSGAPTEGSFNSEASAGDVLLAELGQRRGDSLPTSTSL